MRQFVETLAATVAAYHRVWHDSRDSLNNLLNRLYQPTDAKGSNVEYGLEQLGDAMERLGPATVEWLTLVIPETVNGFILKNRYLYYNDGTQVLIRGKPVNIITTTQ